MEDGELEVGNGEWKMKNGEWEIEIGGNSGQGSFGVGSTTMFRRQTRVGASRDRSAQHRS